MEADEQGLGDQTGQNAPQAGPEMPETDAGEAPAVPQAVPQGKPQNYMFFSNLKVIKDKVEQILAMDVAQVDSMLSDGHDWASDHISTSRDDVEEVYNWLFGEMGDQGTGAEMGPEMEPELAPEDDGEGQPSPV